MARPPEEVVTEISERLLLMPNVVGVGVGEKDKYPIIRVMVEEDPDGVRKSLPTSIEGYPIIVEKVGEIRAL